MGIFDKAKDALSGHSEQVDQGLDKLGDLVDERTGSRYTEQIDKGSDLAGDHLTGRDSDANPPGAPPA